MSDMIYIALVASVAPTITSIASLISSLRNHSKLKILETATNGMQAKLEIAAKAEGVLEEKQRSENQSKP